MKGRFAVAAIAAAVAALAPLGAARANGGVTFSISTPEFGIRVGAPFYGPVFAPPPVFIPAPVYAPAPVVIPAPVYVPPPRVIYPQPVVVVPRVVYPRPYWSRYYAPNPRAYAPPPAYAAPPAYAPPPGYVPTPHYGAQSQQAAYRVPPGHAKRYIASNQ